MNLEKFAISETSKNKQGRPIFAHFGSALMITSSLSSFAPRSHLNHAILSRNFSRTLYSPGHARASMMADHLLRLLGPEPYVVAARKSGSQVFHRGLSWSNTSLYVFTMNTEQP